MSLDSTRQFWNASPCGGHSKFISRRALRYRFEPWLPSTLESIAQKHSNIVEIGCGQGTDGFTLCSFLPQDGSYLGIDYSDESVQAARQSVTEAEAVMDLRVSPTFQNGNAENLEFADESTECVYSLGVLHHTADVPKAVDEVYRILKPGGKAYIYLYRKWSPKVTIAKALRAFQKTCDVVTQTENCIYKLLYGRHLENVLGTMLLECFGVPFMKWYSRDEIHKLFSKFNVVRLSPIGYNIRLLNKKDGLTRLGYFWAIEAQKPNKKGL